MIESCSHSDFGSRRRGLGLVAGVGVAALLLAGCGGSDDETSTAGTGGGGDVPTVVVTTSILGDVVTNLLGDAAEVETIMPTGADPHEFQASAQQAAAMREADVLVVNGADFEEGLVDTIEAAEADGVAVCVAIDPVETLELGSHSHGEGEGEGEGDEHADGEDDHEHEHADGEDEHADDATSDTMAKDDHAEDEHADDATADTMAKDDHDEDGHAEGDEHDHEHAEGSVDPHFFTDPARMAVAAEGLTDCIVTAVPSLDTEEVRSSADAYVAELVALDQEVEATLAVVPEERRVLVTNHEVFGYFADRYGFEVAGTIIPSMSTQSEASAAELAALAELVEAEGVPAVFADTSSPGELAEALGAEVGDVEVVELFTESLGPDGGATYVEMVTTNAQRIADALS